VTSAIGCMNGPSPADISNYALALSAYAYTLYGQNPHGDRQSWMS